jgi:hypothetical protein
MQWYVGFVALQLAAFDVAAEAARDWGKAWDSLLR